MTTWYEQYLGPATGGLVVFGGIVYGQTFTPSVTHICNKVRLYMRPAPGQTLTVELWSVSGGLPNAVLDTATVEMTSGDQWVEASFDSLVTVNASTTYAITHRSTCAIPPKWFNTTPGGYGGGNAVYYNPSTGVWTADTDFDYLFYEGQSLEKAINPTPADEDIDVTTYPSMLFQWEPGDVGCPPDSYKIYVSGGLWWNEYDEVTNLYSLYSGKIYGPKTYWRVDSIYGATTVTGDTWEFTPIIVKSYTLTAPSDPTPLDSSIAGYFSGISCKWKGDSRSSEFEVWSSKNGGADTLLDTLSSRNYTMTGLNDTDEVTWHIKEKVILNSPSAWVEGPSWTFTTSAANYPSSGSVLVGCVPAPTKVIVIAACGTKLYYSEV
jgi:hypothetical protein